MELHVLALVERQRLRLEPGKVDRELQDRSILAELTLKAILPALYGLLLYCPCRSGIRPGNCARSSYGVVGDPNLTWN